MVKIRCNFESNQYATTAVWLQRLFDAWTAGAPVAGVSSIVMSGPRPINMTKESYGLRLVLEDGTVVRIYGYGGNMTHSIAEEVGGAAVSAPTTDGSTPMSYIELLVAGDGVCMNLSGPNAASTNLALAFPASPRHDGVTTSRLAVLWRGSNSSTWNVVQGKGYLQNGTNVVGIGNVFGLTYPVWASSVNGTYDPEISDYVKLGKVMSVRDLYGEVYNGQFLPVIWPALLGPDDSFDFNGRTWHVATPFAGTSDTLMLPW